MNGGDTCARLLVDVCVNRTPAGSWQLVPVLRSTSNSYSPPCHHPDTNQPPTARGGDSGVGGSGPSKAAILRAAQQLQVAARQHLVTLAQQQWEAAAAAAALEPGGEAPAGGAGTGAGNGDAPGGGVAAAGICGQGQAAAGALAGQAVVCALDGKSDREVVKRALELWRGQQVFAFALVLGARGPQRDGGARKPGKEVDGKGPGGDGAAGATAEAAAAGKAAEGMVGDAPQPAECAGAAPVISTAPAAASSATAAAVAAAAGLQRLRAPLQVALCWSDREVLLLALPAPGAQAVAVPGPAGPVTAANCLEGTLAGRGAAEGADAAVTAAAAAGAAGDAAAWAYGSEVWAAVCAMFGSAERTALSCDAAAQLAALEASGVPCRLQVHDPLAAFRLWQPGAEADVEASATAAAQFGAAAAPGTSGVIPPGAVPDDDAAAEKLLSLAQKAVLPSWRLQLPLRHPPPLRRAARAALLARSLHAPLRPLLATRGLGRAYEEVVLPLQRAACGVLRAGFALRQKPLRDILSETRLQLALLRDSQIPRAAAAALAARGAGAAGAAAAAPQLRPGCDADVAALLRRLGLGGGQKPGREARGGEAGVLAALRAAFSGKGAPAGGGGAGEGLGQEVVALLQMLLTEERLREVEGVLGDLIGCLGSRGRVEGVPGRGVGSGAGSSGQQQPHQGQQQGQRMGMQVDEGGSAGRQEGGGEAELTMHPALRLQPVTGCPATALPPQLLRLLRSSPLPLPAAPVLAARASISAGGRRLLPLPAPVRVLLQDPAPQGPQMQHQGAQGGVGGASASSASGCEGGGGAGRFSAMLGAPSPYPCVATLIDTAPPRGPLAAPHGPHQAGVIPPPGGPPDYVGISHGYAGPGAAGAGGPGACYQGVGGVPPMGLARGWCCGEGGAFEDEWIGSTACMREVLPLSAAFAPEPSQTDDEECKGEAGGGRGGAGGAGGVSAALAPGGAALLLARGGVSLRHCVAPSSPGATFIGMTYMDLSVALLAALSGDPALLPACRGGTGGLGGAGGGAGGTGAPAPAAAAAAATPHRPLHAAAAAWVAACSTTRAGAGTVQSLLRSAACGSGGSCVGSGGGAPLPARLAAPAALGALLRGVVLGQRPGQVGEALGCDALAASAALGSVWEAFPGLEGLRGRVIEECAKTG